MMDGAERKIPSPALATLVRDRRKARRLTRRELARIVGCDPSYITLIERDGYVPRRPIATAIAQALGDEEGILLAAGYSNGAIAAVYRGRQRELLEGLCPALRRQLTRAIQLPPERQTLIAHMLNSAMRLA